MREEEEEEEEGRRRAFIRKEEEVEEKEKEEAREEEEEECNFAPRESAVLFFSKKKDESEVLFSFQSNALIQPRFPLFFFFLLNCSNCFQPLSFLFCCFLFFFSIFLFRPPDRDAAMSINLALCAVFPCMAVFWRRYHV